MRNWIKYLHENKIKILVTISMVVLVVAIVQIANQKVKEESSIEKNKPKNNISTIQDVQTPIKSSIDDTKLSKPQAQLNSNLIKQFVDSCNKKSYDIAYNLLSKKCKEYVYTSKENFVNYYVNKIFQAPKTYKLQLWQNNIYQIIYEEGNILSTGGATTNNFIDYIVIVQENENLKLNIGKFIGEQRIQKEVSYSNITIAVNKKTVYMDYEIYYFTIQNNTSNDIVLSDGQDTSSIVLVDKNSAEIVSFVNENLLSDFTIDANTQKQIEIKFNKGYNPNVKIQNIKFKTIYTNKTMYEQSKENVEKVSMQVKL